MSLTAEGKIVGGGHTTTEEFRNTAQAVERLPGKSKPNETRTEEMSRATKASSTCISSKRLNKHNVGLLPKGVSMQWQQTQIMPTYSMFSLLHSSPKSPKPLYIMKGIKEENEQQ